MKIAHVLTYVSADGAYGGPLAVLSAQCEELARRGHEVHVFAGWDGEFDFTLPGVHVHLHRVRRALPGGFSGLIAPDLTRELTSLLDDLDVVHVHLARDLITAPAALAVLSARKSGRSSTRLFVQSHGMVKPDPRLKSRVFDIAIRRILRGADAVLALSPVDGANIRQVAGERARVVELPNGVGLRVADRPAPTTPPEVLFLARLHPRKRVLLFADAARILVESGSDAIFTVIGPDEGDLAELRSRMAAPELGGRLRYEGSVSPGRGPERMAQAEIYVLPSLNEPFPMSVLEALSVGTPVVISSTCHIAQLLSDAVDSFEGGAPELAAVIGRLLDEPARRTQLRESGRDLLTGRLSIGSVVTQLEGYYSAGPRVGVGTKGR